MVQGKSRRKLPRTGRKEASKGREEGSFLEKGGRKALEKVIREGLKRGP